MRDKKSSKALYILYTGVLTSSAYTNPYTSSNPSIGLGIIAWIHTLLYVTSSESFVRVIWFGTCTFVMKRFVYCDISLINQSVYSLVDKNSLSLITVGLPKDNASIVISINLI